MTKQKASHVQVARMNEPRGIFRVEKYYGEKHRSPFARTTGTEAVPIGAKVNKTVVGSTLSPVRRIMCGRY